MRPTGTALPPSEAAEELRHPGRHRTLRRKLARVTLPPTIYFAAFCLYTWPWIAHPQSEFFTDTGDGYQNVWNMWWVNHAMTVLHQSPWHTNMLHYPYGTSLLGQTLNPFNGFVAIVLLRFMPLIVAFNVMVVFSFVATGVSGFWLCRYFSHRDISAIIGGFLVTFSSYHLAKALGLMQLVSMEWVPLFILAWWQLLTAPRRRWIVLTPLSLLLVLLCDYYYFLFSLVAAAAIAIHLWRRREVGVRWRQAAVASTAAAVLTLPLPAALVWSNLRDPMQGGHVSYSSDILALFVDGGHWRFHSLSSWFYGNGPPGPDVSETTIYLSVTVIGLIAAAVVLRDRAGPHTRFWLWFAAVAALLSLGPFLVVDRHDTGIPLLFDLIRIAIPPIDYNLEPERIAVMTSIAAAVLASSILSKMDLRHRKGHRILIGLVCVGALLELWPSPPPSAPVSRPAYVAVLSRLPAGAVIDDAAVRGGQIDKSLQLYDQVLDGKPVAFGYISRTPTSVAKADAALQVAIAQHRYAELCQRYHFTYLTTPAGNPLPSLRPIYDDGQAIIYALCPGNSAVTDRPAVGRGVNQPDNTAQ
jgi:hypothetical protein